MQRTSRFLTVAMLACVVGLHWALLQVVAWTGMVLRYSRDVGVRQAIVMTFDGQHPCPLCLAVKAGRAAERESERFVASAKLEAVILHSEPRVGHAAPGYSPGQRETTLVTRSYAPPKPRPRAVS